MKILKFSTLMTIFFVVSCSSYPTQEEREKNMIQRGFKIGDNRISVAVGDPNTTIISWLYRADKMAENIKHIRSNKELYKSTGYFIECINLSDCPIFRLQNIEQPPLGSAPITPEFGHYLNDYYSQLDVQYKNLNEEIVAIAAEDERRRSNAEEAKEQRELAERQVRYRESQQRIETEKSKINEIAKRSGYKGFINVTIFDFIRETQRAGSLEKYIGYTIGCALYNKSYCENWYPELRIIQVLEYGSLYAFSGNMNGEFLDFTVYIANEKGKIYQDGQQLINNHYVFEGTFSYTAVLGNTKSVPQFGRVGYANKN